MTRIQAELRWLFWDVDFEQLDPDAHPDFVIARILEHGGIAEVRWVMSRYGREGIHRFLREVGHPELSARTLAFWRAVFKAENERWTMQPAWRTSSGVPWNA